MRRISRLSMIILVLTLAAGMVQSPTLAARGGEKGKKTDSTATLVADPNPVSAEGTWFWLSGCGYESDRQVNITVQTPLSMAFWPVGTDSDGCILLTGWWTAEPGDYTITASQRLRGHKQTEMARTTLTVTPR